MPLTALASFIERHRGLLLRATSVWTATGVLLYVWAPLVTPVLLVLAPLGPIAWFIASGRRIPVGSPSPVILMLAVAGVYLAINASWSLSRSDALVALGSFFLFLAAVHVTANTMAECEADILRGIAIGLYAGMVIGGVVLCFETSTLQWLHRTLSSLIPPLRPKPRDMVLDGDWVVFVQSFLINRNIAALTSFFWPTMLAVFLLTPDVRRRPRLLLGLVPMVAAIFGSKHATSKIAFIGAAVAFAIVSISPAVARRGMAWGWVAVIALVVPLATLAYQSHLYLATWLAPSAQHRIVIWGHTSQLIAQSPILGAGINTARALNDRYAHDAPVAPGSDFRLTTSLHSHNVYLQTWYEAGALGAVFLLVVGLLALRSIGQAPPDIQPYLYATFVTCALLGSSSFSLWQPWFMASFGFVALFTAAGWTLAERPHIPDGVSARAAERP